MSVVTINGTTFNSKLQDLLDGDDIEPGSQVSYQQCKDIYSYHPLGLKMAEAPISLAMSQQRELAVPGSPEELVVEAFVREWKALDVDKVIYTLKTTSRIYGIASCALMIDGLDSTEPTPFKKLADKKITFNVFDPLNTAGSLVLNQDANAFDFQKVLNVAVSGKAYHRSRTVVTMNESPLYIEYTTSSFGYVGRSVYQRALYPLKSFLGTMKTDDMVSRKAGLLVAMIKQAGSIADALMQKFTGIKRSLLQQAVTDNVISIGQDDKVESINLQNLDGAAAMARKNILKNIATAADMPAVLLENETLTEGFGEGTEDAKTIAKYVERVRQEMHPLYTFFDEIVMYRAWNPAFFETIKAAHPDVIGPASYEETFYKWKAAFHYEWPSLLIEPESEEIKTEETKYKAILGMVEALLEKLDPDNQAALIEWAQQNFNENKLIFPIPLNLDTDSLVLFLQEQRQQLLAAPPETGDERANESDPGKEPKPKAALRAL